MPLIIREPIGCATQLGVWKKGEDLDFLQSVYPLVPSEKIEFEKISNISRKCEWISTRILLTELIEKRERIEYTKFGKPFLKASDINISISHSKDFICIITSSQYILGIDVEQISPRVKKVSHKFLTESEFSWCQTLEQMTACWSAKEAIFKVFEKELDFKEIEISSFSLEQEKGSFLANTSKKDVNSKFMLNYFKIEENILVYTLKDNSVF